MNYLVDVGGFLERRSPLEPGQSDLAAHLPRHDIHRRPNLVASGHSIGGVAMQVEATVTSCDKR